MAKLNEDKIVEYLNSLPIDNQITLYEKIKASVTTNLIAHQQELEQKANQYQSINNKINGN